MPRSEAKKIRADLALVERGFCESRERAKRLVLAGRARIGTDHVIAKPSDLVAADADLRVQASDPYVSRGAYKLLPALDKHLPRLDGLVVLDVGASTGGFTDLALQRGAATVHAVDAGHGQLHWKLRQDPRVICHERVNARNLAPDFLPNPVDAVVMDVSFISVTKIIPAVAPLLKSGGWAFILIKPQFEAGRGEVGKGGVVRDPAVRARCVDRVAEFAENHSHWTLIDVIIPDITGPKGNVEPMVVFQSPKA